MDGAMDFDACVSCGFACEAVCPVGKATGDRLLSRFLEAVLRDREIVSWPCAGCKACDVACPAELSPRELVNEMSRAYLRHGHNTLSTYLEEYIDAGRLSTSGVNLDELAPLDVSVPVPFLQQFDEVVVFPGCVISARFPSLVARLVEFLSFLGVPSRRIAVEDGACCGSFLERVDQGEYLDNGRHVFSSVLPGRQPRHRLDGEPGSILVLTACGSCTDTLRRVKERLERPVAIDGRDRGEDGRAVPSIEIMHHLELLARPEVLAAVSSHVQHDAGEPVPGYLQYPCLATRSPADAARVKRAMHDLLPVIGITPVVAPRDLHCCGASLLDTHREDAVRYGITHLGNIVTSGATCALVGCGNCHRMLDGFKPSMEIAADRSFPVATRFLLDLVIAALRGEPARDGDGIC